MLGSPASRGAHDSPDGRPVDVPQRSAQARLGQARWYGALQNPVCRTLVHVQAPTESSSGANSSAIRHDPRDASAVTTTSAKLVQA